MKAGLPDQVLCTHTILYRTHETIRKHVKDTIGFLSFVQREKEDNTVFEILTVSCGIF